MCDDQVMQSSPLSGEYQREGCSCPGGAKRKRCGRRAESGDMNAAYDLASMLDEGGDMAGAEGWYRFASTRGHLDSAAELGTMLWKRGEFQEGESWLRKATTSDDPVTANYSAGVLGKCLISLGR